MNRFIIFLGIALIIMGIVDCFVLKEGNRWLRSRIAKGIVLGICLVVGLILICLGFGFDLGI